MARAGSKSPRQQRAKAQRQALLVLGMHRSGTSAVAGMLARLGAQSPQTLMTPTKDNPRGYFESLELKRFHDQLLKSAGSRWKDWEPFPADWSRSAIAAQFAESLPQVLRAEFGDAPLMLIKDPRICRLLPFWLDVLGGMQVQTKVVVPVRHPLEVAGSLEQRDGLSPSESMLVWLRHVLEAELGSRGLPRSFLSYEEVLRDWRPQAAKIAADLGIAWPRTSAEAELEIDDYLTSELKHHSAGAGALQPQLGPWVEPTYQALLELIKDPGSAAAQRSLDEVRHDFDRAGTLFATAMRRQEQRLEGVQAELSKALLQLQEGDRKHADAEAKVAARESQLKLANATLEGQARQLTKQVRETGEALQKLQAESLRTAAKLGETTAKLNQAEELRARERQHFAKLEERFKQDDAKFRDQEARHAARLKEQEAQHQARLKDQDARLVARHREDEARLRDLDHRYRLSEQKLKDSEGRLEDSLKRVSTLHADLAAARALTAAKIEALNAKLNNVEQARVRESEKLGAANARIKDLSAKIEALTARAAEGDADRRKLKAEGQKLQAEKQKLERSLKEQTAKVAMQTARVAEMARTQAKLRETIEEKDRNIATRFRELATLTRMLDELERGSTVVAAPSSEQLRGAPSLAAIRRTLSR